MGFWSSLGKLATGDIGGAATGLAGSAVNLFDGGGSTTTAEKKIAPRSKAEQQLATQQEALANQIQGAGTAQPDYETMFKDMLTRYMGTGSAIGQPTKEQYAAASNFVDQTYTNYAQESLRRQQADLQAKTAAATSVTGRNVGDSAFQRDLANALAQGNAQIQNQRGGLIAQRADELAYQRPAQSLSFLNQLNQQAQQNRYNLLNLAGGMRTQQQQFGLNERLGGATMSETTPGVGLGSRLSGFGESLSTLGPQFGRGVSSLYDTLSGPSGQTPGQYVQGSTPSTGGTNLYRGSTGNPFDNMG